MQITIEIESLGTIELTLIKQDKMRILPFIGSSVILGVATASVLAVQPAVAIDFAFSFIHHSASSIGVQGIIKGLVEGATTAPSIIEVTSSTIGGVGDYSYTGGLGFTVDSSGQVTFSNWFGRGTVGGHSLAFLLGGEATLALSNPPPAPVLSSAAGLSFTPISAPGTVSVPGPLPLLGAAAAFTYSRKLRNLVEGSRTAVSATPSA